MHMQENSRTLYIIYIYTHTIHTHTHTLYIYIYIYIYIFIYIYIHIFNKDLHVLLEFGPGALEDLEHHIVLHIGYKVHHLLMNPLETLSGKSGL
jgi:hypothetical protein